MPTQLGFFFDLDIRYAALTKAGDPLERLAALVDFEAFRYRLDSALSESGWDDGERPAHDCVLMFKILVLQALYNLSDKQAEFQIRDRLSFMRFLGVGIAGKVPDAITIWWFRESLTEVEASANLSTLFEERLKESGYVAISGQIIDASLDPAPRRRNAAVKKGVIKEGTNAVEI